MAVYNGKLYVGGNFSSIGGITAYSIASWDGIQWAPVGPGFSGLVAVMTTDTVNNLLYVGVGGVGLFSWNGNNYTQISGDALGELAQGGKALIMYHGELYSGGGTCCGSNSNGDTLRRVARWDGSQWKPLGWGTNGTVNAFAVYRDTLYVGGSFTKAGEESVYYIAKWHTPDTTVGISEVKGTDYELKIYPNPTKETFTIETHLPNTENVMVRIYGIKGELVKEYAIEKGSNSTILNTSGWAKGVYVCSLEAGGEVVQREKIVVEK